MYFISKSRTKYVVLEQFDKDYMSFPTLIPKLAGEVQAAFYHDNTIFHKMLKIHNKSRVNALSYEICSRTVPNIHPLNMTLIL